MKKIFVIISVLFAAYAMQSCVDPYENEISLGINNYDLTLPKAATKLGKNGENIHYIQIASTGPWEATITPQNEGEIWCWLWDHHVTVKKDADGKEMKDDDDVTYLYDYHYVAEGVEYFEGSTTKFRKVRGNAGVIYLPLEYSENKGSKRYAVFHIRRTDTGESRTMYITQNS